MARPATPLSPNLLVRKEDVSPEIKPPPAKPTGKMMISYRPEADLYERLRALGYKQRRKMQSLLDEAVHMLLDANE